ncbi:glycosyltransferase family 4 protein [Aeromonas caviae]|uniref:glycosyltransferase family 4 protein n=1 Tax=Aeromonas caviae TaxID=648 RepID=UPI002B47B560|nr:glycosyltransferase family 4 protein [Aeromonas caviae]
MSTIVFYCNWGVAIDNGNFYLPAVHNMYINEALKCFDEVVLISKKVESSSQCSSLVSESVKIYTLPVMSNYLSGLKSLKQIYKTFSLVSKSYPQASYYIRSPEPYNWIFSFIMRGNNKLVYHFMSNPIEAILNNCNDSYLKKYFKLFLYFPDFLLSCYAGRRKKITCNGLGLKNKLLKYFGYKCHVLNESTITRENLINQDSIKDKTISGKVKILYVGYIRPAKGLDYLIDALKIDNLYKQVDLTLVGDGEYSAKLKNRVIKENMGNSIHFLGHIEHGERLLDLYKRSDIFAFPSLSEGSPRVVLEAMAYGLPVIASDVGNTRFLLENGRGICIPPKNSQEMHDAILKMIEEPKARLEYALNGLSFAEKNTIEHFFTSFKKFSES